MKIFVFKWEYEQCVGGSRTYDIFKKRDYIDVIVAKNREEAEKLLTSLEEYGSSHYKLMNVLEIDASSEKTTLLVASNHYRCPLKAKVKK